MVSIRLEDCISIDFETYSESDLKKVGSHKYSMDQSTEVLCFAWARFREEPRLWTPGMPFPDELADHILEGKALRAWNAMFERLIFTHVGSRYGWPVPSVEQFVCTMTEALAMALPGKLENCAPAVGLEVKKDLAGSRIMLQLCKPRKPTKVNKATRWTPENAPFKFEHLYAYCEQDVRVEAAIAERVTRLHPKMQAFYWRDQYIQDRGITVDLDLVDAAKDVVEQHLTKLDEEIRSISNRAIASTSATKQIVTWLGQTGVTWPITQHPSVDKDNVIRLLGRDDLTAEQRRVIEIRQEAGKASTAKLDRIETMVCDDGTIKGSLQFQGTSTGRDAARGVQFQNLPRPTKGTNVKQIIELIVEHRDAEMIDTIFGGRSEKLDELPITPMSLVSDILRSTVIAAPGKKLYTRDLSQIEARMTNYLAGETRGIEAFRAYDTIIGFDAKGNPIRKGPDIYTVSASGIYDKPASLIDVKGDERQVGKVSTLALGFGGGAGAFGSMAKIYRLNLAPLFPIVWGLADEDSRKRATEAWKQRGRGSGMKKEAWLASEIIKMAWRDSNPKIVQFWKDLENAAIDAVLNPGQTFVVRGIRFRKTGSFLRMVLISGRSLFFPFPRLELGKTPWGTQKYMLYFKAVDGLTKRFMEFSLWGGLICQNAVQATSADVMLETVVRLEDAGYPNILRIHDEMIHETPEDFGDEDEFHSIVVQPPRWAPGLPIAADGYVATRYRK